MSCGRVTLPKVTLVHEMSQPFQLVADLLRVYLAISDLIVEVRALELEGREGGSEIEDTFATVAQANRDDYMYMLSLFQFTLGCVGLHTVMKTMWGLRYRRTTYSVRQNEADPLARLFWIQYSLLLLPIAVLATWNLAMTRGTSLGWTFLGGCCTLRECYVLPTMAAECNATSVYCSNDPAGRVSCGPRFAMSYLDGCKSCGAGEGMFAPHIEPPRREFTYAEECERAWEGVQAPSECPSPQQRYSLPEDCQCPTAPAPHAPPSPHEHLPSPPWPSLPVLPASGSSEPLAPPPSSPDSIPDGSSCEASWRGWVDRAHCNVANEDRVPGFQPPMLWMLINVVLSTVGILVPLLACSCCYMNAKGAPSADQRRALIPARYFPKGADVIHEDPDEPGAGRGRGGDKVQLVPLAKHGALMNTQL
jgi:hypothetical protein